MSAALQHLGERLALIKPGHHPIAGDMTVLEAEIKKLEQR